MDQPGGAQIDPCRDKIHCSVEHVWTRNQNHAGADGRPPDCSAEYAGILTRAIQVRILPTVAQKTNNPLFNSNLSSARKVSRVSLVLAHDSAETRTNSGAEMHIWCASASVSC